MPPRDAAPSRHLGILVEPELLDALDAAVKRLPAPVVGKRPTRSDLVRAFILAGLRLPPVDVVT